MPAEAGCPVQLLISKAARSFIHMETDLRLPAGPVTSSGY